MHNMIVLGIMPLFTYCFGAHNDCFGHCTFVFAHKHIVLVHTTIILATPTLFLCVSYTPPQILVESISISGTLAELYRLYVLLQVFSLF
jgi:hypothetical protein